MKGQEQGLERGRGLTASKGTTQSYTCKDCVLPTAWLILQERLPQRAQPSSLGLLPNALETTSVGCFTSQSLSIC